MSDWSQLSTEKHELDYILDKYDKRRTQRNRELLAGWIDEFKELHGGPNTKDYTKDEFYNFINPRVDELE